MKAQQQSVATAQNGIESWSHSPNEMLVSPRLTPVSAIVAMTFWGDAIGLDIPPMLQANAMPSSEALESGSGHNAGEGES